VSAENFERALVPWSILAKRESTDAAVHEAMLALPYAYSQLDVHGRAAVLYGQAVNAFGNELEKMNASIERIREGNFLEALTREEIRQDKDWVVYLRSLPEAPETFYLLALMASHDFQTSTSKTCVRSSRPGRSASTLSRTSSLCGARTTNRCCPRSIFSFENSTHRFDCGRSSASISMIGFSNC
jgi:hypothetical protein